MIYANRNKMYAIISYLCISFYCIYLLINEWIHENVDLHLFIFALMAIVFLVNAIKGVKTILKDGKSFLMLLVTVLIILVILMFIKPSLSNLGNIIYLLLTSVVLAEINYRFNHKLDLFK